MPLNNLYTARIPRSILESPETPEEVTWTCPTCGTVEPRRLTWPGSDVVRYQKAQCPCQIEASRARKAEQERKDFIESSYPMIYNWLATPNEPMPLRAKTFTSFDPSRQPEAYEIAQVFADQPTGTLILYGTYGTGKTHLLAAICNATLEVKSITSLFTTAPKLFNAIQERIQINDGYANLIRRACTTSLLVLDDIDKAKYSSFREEIYFEIFDERVQRGLPTAISTNRLDDLASFVGGAVYSRLKVGQIAVPMVGNDYRELL